MYKFTTKSANAPMGARWWKNDKGGKSARKNQKKTATRAVRYDAKAAINAALRGG